MGGGMDAQDLFSQLFGGGGGGVSSSSLLLLCLLCIAEADCFLRVRSTAALRVRRRRTTWTPGTSKG